MAIKPGDILTWVPDGSIGDLGFSPGRVHGSRTVAKKTGHGLQAAMR
jgi:hypothetical protein